MSGHPQCVPHRKDGDCHHSDAQAIGEQGLAEGEAALAGDGIHAYQAYGQPKTERGKAPEPRRSKDGGHCQECKHHDGEVRPARSRVIHHPVWRNR